MVLKWHGAFSDSLTNGVKQCVVLSLHLFNVQGVPKKESHFKNIPVKSEGINIFSQNCG